MATAREIMTGGAECVDLTKIEILEQLGPTAIAFVNTSGADPLGTLKLYGEEVLPRLRSGEDSMTLGTVAPNGGRN